MNKTAFMASAMFALTAVASPASAVTNLIKNGSFELSAPGVGTIANWTKSNVPGNAPASVITYNNTFSYPFGAFNESVAPNNAVTNSPDAVGNQAAYFVGDLSVNETISQLTYLGVGNYEVGFSRLLTANGLRNPNNASIDVSIIGTRVAFTDITSTSQGQTWVTRSGVAQITQAGWYLTSLVFNSNGSPAKDVVVDNVFAIRTNLPPTVSIPPNPVTVPEPETWALLVIGFGLVGAAARRRKTVVAA